MAIENNKPTVIASEERAKQSHNAKESNKQIASSLAMTDRKVPKLRFKEFEGEWEEYSFPSLINKANQGVNTTTEKVKYSENGIKVIRSNNIGNNVIDFCDVKYVDEETFKRLSVNCKPVKGDILYCNIGSDLGSAALYNFSETILVNWNVFRIQPNSKLVDRFLLTQYLNKIKPNIRKFATESTMPFISSKAFKFIKFKIPNLPEQQKIANFLTAVDTKIQQLNTKKDHLEQYKKGVMQQLFSQQLRFKDDNGEAFADWEEKKLGEVLTIGSGRDYKHLEEGDIPVYGTGGYMTSVNEYLFNGESVGIGRKGTIDKPVFLKGKFWTVDTLFYTHSFKNVLPYFIYLIFQTINWKLYNEASGVPSLSKSTLEKIKISIPSLPEQQKTANYLSAIDLKIEAVNTQISNTHAFKKGLLQQMFV
ncbi:restriction endonuclease subunit S [Lacinutrix undariae]